VARLEPACRSASGVSLGSVYAARSAGVESPIGSDPTSHTSHLRPCTRSSVLATRTDRSPTRATRKTPARHDQRAASKDSVRNVFSLRDSAAEGVRALPRLACLVRTRDRTRRHETPLSSPPSSAGFRVSGPFPVGPESIGPGSSALSDVPGRDNGSRRPVVARRPAATSRQGVVATSCRATGGLAAQARCCEVVTGGARGSTRGDAGGTTYSAA
jgi:hypothetical protein